MKKTAQVESQMDGQLEMFAAAGLTEPPGFPPLEHFDGQPVTWQEWEGVPATTHVDWVCEHCGATWTHGENAQRPFITFGKVSEMIRLVAYWCGRCGRCEVLDKHRDHRQVSVTLLVNP